MRAESTADLSLKDDGGLGTLIRQSSGTLIWILNLVPVIDEYDSSMSTGCSI
jgi:hypothetical protein